MKFKRALSVIVCFLMIVGIMLVPIDSKAAKLKLSKTKVTMNVGDSASLTAKLGKKKISKAKWKTSNKKVVTVSKGKVKAKSVGKAKITATYKGKKSVCNITVVAKNTNTTNTDTNANTNTNQNTNTNTNTTPAPTPTPVAEPVYAISQSTASVEVEKTLKLTVTEDGSVINSGVTWSSSNANVASVSYGTVTAKGPGNATITATAGGKQLTCTVTVTVPNYTISNTKATLDTGDRSKNTIQLYLKNGSTNVSGATWESDDEDVATVDEDGLVTAMGDGTANIIATKYGKECECTVKVDGFVFSRDVEIVDGEIDKYVEFKFNKDEVTADELKEAGYTVNGEIASVDTKCPTRTYTFKNNRLPVTLDEFKQIPLDDEFGAMAATICAMATADVNSYNMQNIEKSPTCDILDYLNGSKCEFNNYAKQHLASNTFPNLRKTGAQNCFFAGATPENGYTPSKPLSFTLYVGPYYIPASNKSIAYGNTPERHMVLLSFGGDDSERYIDVYKSSDGNWYSWMDQWKHMGASFRDAAIEW